MVTFNREGKMLYCTRVSDQHRGLAVLAIPQAGHQEGKPYIEQPIKAYWQVKPLSTAWHSDRKGEEKPCFLRHGRFWLLQRLIHTEVAVKPSSFTAPGSVHLHAWVFQCVDMCLLWLKASLDKGQRCQKKFSSKIGSWWVVVIVKKSNPGSVAAGKKGLQWIINVYNFPSIRQRLPWDSLFKYHSNRLKC